MLAGFALGIVFLIVVLIRTILVIRKEKRVRLEKLAKIQALVAKKEKQQMDKEQN